ncbi:MAG TPA: 3'-5' exonuclease [Terracidiphilus sp.]|nr:3'-5' exonuclease [Terracidiphilus sp.]
MIAIIAVVVCAAICLFLIFFVRRVLTGPESEPQTHVAPPPEQVPASLSAIGVPTVSQHVPDSAPAYLHLLPESFVVVDLETTGLNPAADEIIEIGAIKAVLNSTNHLAFQMLVKPNGQVPKSISKMTGITQTMVDTEGVPISEALTQFLEFVGGLPLVTYNAEFDMGFLWAAAKGCGLTINNRYACALKMARRAWPGLPNYRLATLGKLGNLSDVDTHRAVGDCERALIVFTSATSVLGQKVRWSKPVSNVGRNAGPFGGLIGKPILCLDFDGVCHLYTSGWKGADIIPDPHVPGLFEFLEQAQPYFDIQIFSSRSHQEGGVEAMSAWFIAERRAWINNGGKPTTDDPLELKFPKEKPPAFLGIDDRVINFRGEWPDVEEIRGYKTWTQNL